MAAHKCFNCGEHATMQIANSRPPENRRWLCHAEKCWSAWQHQFGKPT